MRNDPRRTHPRQPPDAPSRDQRNAGDGPRRINLGGDLMAALNRDEINPAEYMEATARALLGEPNPRLSNRKEMRFGSHGSLAVDLEKGLFFDHEANAGGGVLDLIRREKGETAAGALEWLRANVIGEAAPRPPLKTVPPQKTRIVETYRYEDERGVHLFDVVRFEPKDFRQRAADGSWSVKGIRKVLYRLPQITAAHDGAFIYIVEGEKDVHRLEAEGLLATTCPGGAGKWNDDFPVSLKGKTAIVLPDNDQAGRDHAAKVKASLDKAGVTCRILHLEGLPPKGDVSDWLDAGNDGEELDGLAVSAIEDDTETTDTPIARTQFRGIETAGQFARRWTPPQYIVDGILARRRVQALTAYTGHMKTTTAIYLAICIATGQPFGGAETEKGAVLILAGENPDLVVGQFRAACLAADLSPEDLPISFHYGRFSVTEHADALMAQASKIEDLALIIPDTHQAFFEGNDDNSNMDALAAAQKWRPFAEELPTHPTVLIPAHPSGKQPDRNNLVPRGGSAFLNELDGNFCLWRKADVATFHWQGKHRGPSFEPIDLKMDLRTHPEIVDAKGREIPMPVVRPLLTIEAMEAAKEAVSTENRALVAIRSNPNITVRELADAINKGKSRAAEIISALEGENLIRRRARKLELTAEGEEVLADANL
ncbi:AAA family ATPase [Ovoidimarina sediminis]|uniref:AAA family ATPase n=1 Tax=Ovoidimarina sediminis TaxID=3079856 RepID=UPI00290C0FA8|nr:AAA family ATPase [Rhodophyticola sp. MJ-SS7]MDU8946392.1 AAA family ATPase [Rhodophyticola sp. MJ-SS7]